MSLSLYVGPDSQPDKYRLVRSVGRGGEATLYLAEVTLAGQTEPVVVKALNADITADSAQFAELSSRWAEQAELLRFINRLGVVGVREHFEGAPEHPQDRAGEQTDRCLYLVMNHVDGLDLRDWRAEHAQEGERGQREVLRYLEQVAQVLDLLHAGRATPSRRPVVHGDLSPGNIMIDADGQATLVDFGLSRIAARHMTARPWFTPGYAAPEIFSGEYSPATDRYAFGAVAFYALTGEDPPTAPEQLRERFAALPLLADADERTRALVVSMFSAEPADRPEASAWVGALRTLATSVPWTGPGSDPAGDPGTSAVFAASLFSAVLPGPAAPDGLPQGPAVAGPPPASQASPDAPASDNPQTPEASAASAPDAPGSGSATDATVVLSPPPGGPQTPEAPGVPSASGAAQAPAAAADAAAVAGGAQGTDATVVLSPTSGAAAGPPGGPQPPGTSVGTPASGVPSGSGAPQVSGASVGTPASGVPTGAPALGAPSGTGAPEGTAASADASATAVAGGAQGMDATVVLSPTSGVAAGPPGGPQPPGASVGTPASGVPSGPGTSQVPGAHPGAQGAATSGGAQGPAVSAGAPAPAVPGGTPASGVPAVPGGQGTDATVVLPPPPPTGAPVAGPAPEFGTPGAGTPAAGTPAFGTPAAGRTPASGTPAVSSDTESTAVLPQDGPGVEEMPHRPVGGMRGRPAPLRPTSGPSQPSAPPAPAGPPPGRPGGPTPPGGMARPPMPPPGSGPVRSGPMHSGPAYGGPPPAQPRPAQPQPAWGPPPPPTGTGAFPAFGHQPAPEPPKPGKKSRKPLLIGLAALAVLCMIGGSALTYVVMDRGLPFLSDGAQQVAADDPAEPPAAASETAEEAPPMAAQPTGAPKDDASEPDTDPGDDPGTPTAGDTTLLTQMPIVDQDGYWGPETGRAEVDGQAYSRALISVNCEEYNDTCTGWADYNLGRKWTAFTATIGVDDTSSASATTTFTVYVDGEAEVTETLKLGETLDIDVDVRDALRLRIEVESDGRGIYPVWADPTLTA
ncbi:MULTISPECIES: protein kinase domain-containing protein [unclassified Nocardiopsis]|uniref:protein kinase domain-containing protein n=1 Tax=Nocardiopsis TaxID=2013 RepID=UPI00387A96E3